MPGNVRSKSISASIVLKVILVLLPLQVDGGTSSTHRENQCKDALREGGQYN